MSDQLKSILPDLYNGASNTVHELHLNPRLNSEFLLSYPHVKDEMQMFGHQVLWANSLLLIRDYNGGSTMFELPNLVSRHIVYHLDNDLTHMVDRLWLVSDLHIIVQRGSEEDRIELFHRDPVEERDNFTRTDEAEIPQLKSCRVMVFPGGLVFTRAGTNYITTVTTEDNRLSVIRSPLRTDVVDSIELVTDPRTLVCHRRVYRSYEGETEGRWLAEVLPDFPGIERTPRLRSRNTLFAGDLALQFRLIFSSDDEMMLVETSNFAGTSSRIYPLDGEVLRLLRSSVGYVTYSADDFDRVLISGELEASVRDNTTETSGVGYTHWFAILSLGGDSNMELVIVRLVSGRVTMNRRGTIAEAQPTWMNFRGQVQVSSDFQK